MSSISSPIRIYHVSPPTKILATAVLALAAGLTNVCHGADESLQVMSSLPVIRYPSLGNNEPSVAKQVVTVERSFAVHGYFEFLSLFGVGAWVISSSRRVRDNQVAFVQSMGAADRAADGQWVWGIWPFRRVKLVDVRPKGQIFTWRLEPVGHKASIDLEGFVTFRKKGRTNLASREMEKLVYRNFAIILRNAVMTELELEENASLALKLIHDLNQTSEKYVEAANQTLGHFGIQVMSLHLIAREKNEIGAGNSSRKLRPDPNDDSFTIPHDRPSERALTAGQKSRDYGKFRKVSYKQRYLI